MKRPIFGKLYQFSQYIPRMDFTIHQYLLAPEPSILFATGTVQQAERSLPEIEEILGGRPLDYIFVSHMESDEYGGIRIFLERYPDAKVICSRLASRELPGLGVECDCVAADGDTVIEEGDISLKTITYPCEVHLQDGIIAYEQNSGILYSSDLMQSPGDGRDAVEECGYLPRAESIAPVRIPNGKGLEDTKRKLASISPRFVAVGHGFCFVNADIM